MGVLAQGDFVYEVSLLIQWARKNGYVLTFGEAFRTPEQQALHIAAGRSTTKNSRHLVRMAIDFNVFKDGKLLSTKAQLKPVGDYWESLGDHLVWGGSFKSFFDGGHFQSNAE